jgi:hypothetical protein
MSLVGRRAVAAALLAALAALASGCATTSAVRVRPWERGNLADSTMNPDRDPLATGLSDHVNFAREAANGGKGVGGSGCGCN